MCHSADHPRRDEGFTLLEVVVALGVTTVVMMALLPQLVAGIRSTGTANSITQAKGILQAELEMMRNLPYHVAPSAGAYADVLDRYYPGLGAPAGAPACGSPHAVAASAWTGYVAPTSPARCAFEPPTGAFYRTVRRVDSERGPMILVVATQFLSDATPPVPTTPRTGYDSTRSGRHLPVTNQLGVTATVLRTDGAAARRVTTYTQISGQPSAPARVSGEADATAVHIGSVTFDKRSLSLSAGLVAVRGSSSSVSTVAANASSVTAGLSSGEQASGAAFTGQAPPSTTIAAAAAGAGGLPVWDCLFACWSPSRVSGATVGAQDGLPMAGSSSVPVQAAVTDTSAHRGFRFGTLNDSLVYRPLLQLTGDLVRMDDTVAPYPTQLTGCTVTAGGAITSSAYLQTSDGAAAGVESCAVARATAVTLFPTLFAPRGVVRVELQHASARCSVSPAGGTSAHDYRAVVQVWNGLSYDTVATAVAGQTTDPLAGVSLTRQVGGGRVLGDYIASWSTAVTDPTGASGVAVRALQGQDEAEISIPGVVTVASQPLRNAALSGADPDSALSLALGAVGCRTEDAR